ncbi:MAG: deoxyribodipyrimidine photo-lyase [Planctomycetaceae bacterium]
MVEPWEVETQQGNPYQVFTPFWKSVRQKIKPEKPLAKPESVEFFHPHVKSVKLDDYELLPVRSWAKGFHDCWKPENLRMMAIENITKGIESIQKSSETFTGTGNIYVCRLLHFGEVSPRQIWHAVGFISTANESQMEKRVRIRI